MLEQKHVEPPFKPDQTKLLDALQPHPDFDTMLKEFKKSHWLEESINAQQQVYFQNWSVK
jgi:hypothetical protein